MAKTNFGDPGMAQFRRPTRTYVVREFHADGSTVDRTSKRLKDAVVAANTSRSSGVRAIVIALADGHPHGQVDERTLAPVRV